MQLLEVEEQILNTIGLQQLLRKQGNIYMNIWKLLGLHKGHKSFQLQDFRSLLQHNGRQGYKQGLDYLFVVTLNCACFIWLSNQNKGGELGFRRITNSSNQDHNQKEH